MESLKYSMLNQGLTTKEHMILEGMDSVRATTKQIITAIH